MGHKKTEQILTLVLERTCFSSWARDHLQYKCFIVEKTEMHLKANANQGS